MSGRQTIKQRIAFEGGEAMKAQLQALGDVGEKAFKKIGAATKQADFAKLSASLSRVGSDLATVGRRLTLAFGAITTSAGAAGVAMVALARNSALTVTEAGKAAASAGLQIDAYGRLAFAAEAAYVSQSDFQAGMNRLNKELGAALAGNKASADKFKMLGIAIRDANGKIRPTEAIVRDLARAFARMPDSARKSALAMEFFGKSGASLIPFLNQGADGLKELADKAERLGIVFSPDQLKIGDALRTALDDMGTAVKAARVQLGLLFAPGVTRAANSLRDMIVKNRQAMLDFVSRAVEPATILIKDFVSALTGRDADVQNKWIIDWRDGIIQFGKDAYNVANSVVLPAFKAIHGAATGVTEAINKLFGTNLTGGQLLIGASLLNLIGGFKLLRSGIMLAVEAIALLARVFWANPWASVIVGIGTLIAGWATQTGEATRALQVHEDLVGKVRDAYDQAGRKVADMTQQMKDQALIQARLSLEAANKGLDASINDAINAIEQFDGLLPHAADKLFEVFKQFKNTRDVEAFREEISKLGAASPELGKLAQQFLDLTEAPHKFVKDAAESVNWINVTTGAITDSQFAQRQAALGIAGYAGVIKQSADEIKGAGEAVAQTSAKVEDLGNTITVTKYGANGPVKQVFELANGVARAVDQSKVALDDLNTSSDATGQKIKSVTDGVASAIRSLPEELRGQTTPAEALTEGLDKAGADIQQVATEITIVAGSAKQGVDALGQSWADTNKQAADTISALPDGARAAVDGLATEVARIPTIFADVQGSSGLSDAIMEPFRQLPGQIDAIMAAIKAAVEGGFSAISSNVRQIGSEITTMINSIIAALRQAAAQAAKLRSSAASSSSSSSRSGGKGFSLGGRVWGAGTSTSDSIPAWLSNGEFVARERAVSFYGPGLFHALNNLQLPRDFLDKIKGFNLGGLVNGIRSRLSSFNIPQFANGGLVNAALAPVAAASGRPVVLQLPGGQMIAGFTGTEDAISQLQRHAAGKAVTSAGRKPGWYK
ncbi:hypothetical protein [Pseudaminobacter soli (ex Li et al. 2025)]|uniref:Bacteriophage tail tape measure N-terminal domain-containing protein n=1 Tax=Pseudaminobacter soli (ex Li et al. 2025) TaxID=1295366 RepID=A0A2P7RZW9_9HYPH|nr:hypothetical protein [Mesorhizobium soli]PSJ55760.1 hypothetical protein C7I85_26070 [Mesorhizobium soli]